MSTRRDFLKVLGGALGTVVLTSACGGGGGTLPPGVAPIPNGYRFFRILSSGDALPGGDSLGGIPGSVSINNSNEIYFYGMDQQNINGYYELLMDYAGSQPGVVQMRKVVREGDTLNDSKEVTQINMSVMNDQASVAAVLQTSDKLSGLYLEREKKGFTPVAEFLSPLPGGGGTFGAAFGDVDIHTNDDILFVSHFSPSATAQSYQGLFYLPGGEVNQQGSILSSTRELIPGIDGTITGFGLVNLNAGGNYVTQSYGITAADQQQQMSSATSGGPLDSASKSLLIQGQVNSQASKSVRVASPNLTLAKTGAATPASGEIMFAPRIGPNNDLAYINNTSATQQILNYKGTNVFSSGSISPLGATIVSMSAPVVGADGLLYTQAVTDKGLELIVNNGAESRTILAKDDLLDGKPLQTFFFGFMPDQVDSSGRIVLTGDFADGTNSLIVGIPI